MSKEELKNVIEYYSGDGLSIEEIISIIAEQEAIGFQRWFFASDWTYEPDQSGRHTHIETDEKKTIIELYNIYKQSKEQ